MGCVASITKDTFPKQGEYLNQRAKVYFHYDTQTEFLGTIVRDDMESPWHTIIKLDDGRVVLTTECQYSPVP
jgi:hypothetical protein